MRAGILLTLGCLLAAQALGSDQERFVGHAYALDSGELLYREEHRIELDSGVPLNATVHYTHANESDLGVKTVTFVEPARPAYEFEFADENMTTERVHPSDTGVQIESRNQGIIDWPSGAAVIDSGFHYFILDHFDSLVQGDTIRFEFLAPTRLSWTSLIIEQRRLTEETLVLVLKPRNRLIALFFDPIQLTYSRDSQRLMEYRGLTNIPKPGGGNYTARIEYRYQETLAYGQ